VIFVPVTVTSALVKAAPPVYPEGIPTAIVEPLVIGVTGVNVRVTLANVETVCALGATVGVIPAASALRLDPLIKSILAAEKRLTQAIVFDKLNCIFFVFVCGILSNLECW
jgi:hypothetical protein